MPVALLFSAAAVLAALASANAGALAIVSLKSAESSPFIRGLILKSIPVVTLAEQRARPSPWGPFHAFRPDQREFVKLTGPMTQCEQEREMSRLGVIAGVVAPHCDENGDYEKLQYAGYPSFCQFCVNPRSNAVKACSKRLREDPNLQAPICDWAFDLSRY